MIFAKCEFLAKLRILAPVCMHKNITRLVEIPLGTIAVKVCCYDGQLEDAGAQCGPQGQYLFAGPQC